MRAFSFTFQRKSWCISTETSLSNKILIKNILETMYFLIYWHVCFAKIKIHKMSRGECRVQWSAHDRCLICISIIEQGGFPVVNVNNWQPSDINDEQIAIIRPGIRIQNESICKRIYHIVNQWLSQQEIDVDNFMLFNMRVWLELVVRYGSVLWSAKSGEGYSGRLPTGI